MQDHPNPEQETYEREMARINARQATLAHFANKRAYPGVLFCESGDLWVTHEGKTKQLMKVTPEELATLRKSRFVR